MKWIVYITVVMSILPAFAQVNQSGGQRRHGGRPGGGVHQQLTDEQKQCLSGILGEPGQGERPSREAKESAFQQCGISNSENAKPHGPPPNLTKEQITCLESKIGKPGESERPSEEAFKQAHADCGVELPSRASDNQ